MDDLEITRLCARAAGLEVVKVDDPSNTLTRVVDSQDPRGGWYFYRPLKDRALALELVERLRLDITPFGPKHENRWTVCIFDPQLRAFFSATDPNLLRAICLCAARVQQARESQK